MNHQTSTDSLAFIFDGPEWCVPVGIIAILMVKLGEKYVH